MNYPLALTQEQIDFILIINTSKGKHLISLCREKKVKQSIQGNTNIFCKRINLIKNEIPELSHHQADDIACWGENDKAWAYRDVERWINGIRHPDFSGHDGFAGL